MRPGDGRSDLFVTAAASRFRNPFVPRPNQNIVWKSPRRKSKRVEESVLNLGRVLARKIMRSVAIVASSHRAVRRFDPRIVILLHDVAVRARLRIVRKIRISACVHKCIDSKTGSHADQNGHEKNEILPHADLFELVRIAR